MYTLIDLYIQPHVIRRPSVLYSNYVLIAHKLQIIGRTCVLLGTLNHILIYTIVVACVCTSFGPVVHIQPK